ncbi:hypothetical protein FRB97_003614 [Tulasnella sp. 331]|nr:hypothetical protein FRB97_003614 [Tulasnella sp. 331]
MADLFNAQYAPRISSGSSQPLQPHQQQQQLQQQQQQQQQQQHPSSSSSYTPFTVSQSQSNVDPDHNQQDSREAPKMEAKPQATFLTKLYALLERPEYQSMIRWDANGEQIIVERPEQLALHVLPSIYRQSRFASFSRQLNIYGFMRKVNLRNVDPAIDDPDASTWSHPTLTRNSAPEVVANFKRRVPPRLPKNPRKRSDTADGLPRLDVSPSSANSHPPHHPNAPQNAGPIGLPSIPMSMAVATAQSDLGIGSRHNNNSLSVSNNRPRGLSAPGPYGQQQYASGPGSGGLQMPNSAGYANNGSKWGQQQQQQQYTSRTPLPPLSIPGGGSSSSNSGGSSGLFTGGSFSAHPTTLGNLSPLSTVHDSHHHSSHHPYSAGHHDSSYGGSGSHHQQTSHHGGSGRDQTSSVFNYGSNAFSSDPNASHGGGGHSSGASNSNSNWSSYLPPASSLGQGQSGSSTPLPFPPVQRPSLPTTNSFSGSYSHQSSSHHGHHNMSSPDSSSRPATGYGNTSPYDMDSAQDSGRGLSPSSNSLRPSSAKSIQAPQNPALTSLSIRNSRPRRRSDAVTQPYPSPMYGGYGNHNSDHGNAADIHGLNFSRPGTAPEPSHKAGAGAGIQLPSVSSVDPYHQFNSATSNSISADFAYSPTHATNVPHHSQQGGADSWNKSLRPSTSTSSISATSTSMIHTPPIMEDQEEGGSSHTATNGNGNGRGRGGSTGSNGSLGAADNDISRYNDFFSITTSSMSNNETGGSSATSTAFDHSNPFASLLEEERKSTASSKSLSPMGNLAFAGNTSASPGIMDFKDPFKTLID